MEDIANIIRMKHLVLDKHLDFVEKMLKKTEGTKFENMWKHMNNCITSDRKM